MELAHSLLLNEEAMKRIPESKRPVFVFEWLRFLDKVLLASQKSDIKGSQKKLVAQLTAQITESSGPPTRKLLARCLALIFSVGDTIDLFATINKCNDIIKNKDDSPSYLPSRLAAIACLGAMYEKLGRMTGRSYEDTVQILIKSLKNAESQGRFEIMQTLEKLVCGLGSAGGHTHKDIYKACRGAMTDRAMAVRQAAARCMHSLVLEAPFMSTTELETVANVCFRALDGSNYDTRCIIAKLLGYLMAAAQTPKIPAGKTKPAKLEDVLSLLSSGFIKGTLGGFLKTSTAGEMIKGTNSVNREVRVGITHAYVELIKCMGGLWLERNISVFLTHVLELVAHPRATPTHVDAVYARKCVQFIMRSVIGGMLGEKAQIAAAKEICQVILKQMNTVGEATAEASEGKGQASAELTASQHVLVCALHELGCLVLRLGTSASPLVAEPATGIIEPVVSVLIHPSHAARLSASWCLASIAVALPGLLTPLLDRCVERMDKLRSSPEATAGYSSALAALLGGVYQCPLGIPHSKGKQIFTIAEELLRTASQNSRLSLQRTQSGWLLLGALMTLGPSVIKNHLPRMLLLWRNAFPRSVRELESEKVRGEAFTWQVTLEGRAGALGAMYSFLLHCRDLVTEDVIRRMLAPLECALVMMTQLASVIKMYGTQLKASAATIRLRLYDVLSLLPPESFDGLYPNLLRELVAEFTLTDNPANTTTSQLRFMCHADDSVILGSWLQETDHKAIEDQLQPNSASGSGTLEHDSQSLYIRCNTSEPIPGPLPLGVAVIDSSVKLYGVIFPHVAHKHRYQMLHHFNECIRQAKGPRQQAVQMNVFTAVLCALKSLADLKANPGPDDVRKAAFALIMDAMSSANPILRCAAGEALGRMAQVVGDSKFIAEMAQHSFDKLKSARDVVSRTGHSLALGCLHRYVGGMGSNQHLNTSVSILLALAQDFNSPVVQVWALHALSLIADSGGPMFRSYVEPTLSLVLQLLLCVPPAIVDVHQCLGKCLSALITSIGPELQGNSQAIGTARLYCLVCCAVMQAHPDSLVQAEAITCLQQLHMFAPRHLNLSSLVPHLCENLGSSHLLLRRAAVSCLRQLATREAGDVSALALTLVAKEDERGAQPGANFSESGLEGVLFGMLDTETDTQLLSDLRDTILSLLQALAIPNLGRWLQLLKDVLSASTDATSEATEVVVGGDDDDDDDDEGGDDNATFTSLEPDVTHPSVAPRWPTRVFAVECLMKIITSAEGGEGQFDLHLAKELKENTGKNNFLVLHLSDLIRMAFIAATSDSNQLRLVGLSALEEVILRFAAVPEPEFPGHVILEQYQAQVGAALRPAFSPDTPSDVTAAACEVCSKWIGSGVARDLNDLRRVHQLLVSSLAKLGSVSGRPRAPLYNESASTMEKLAVITAWAEVYIVAVDREQERKRASQGGSEGEGFEPPTESLLSLVQPELQNLSRHWFSALRDHALLALPQEYWNQLPSEGGAFYHPDTVDTAVVHYRRSWPSILHGLATWLEHTGFEMSGQDPESDKGGKLQLGLSGKNTPANMRPRTINQDRFFLILGITMEALCNSVSRLEEKTVQHCLRALRALLTSQWPRTQLGKDARLSRELLNVMHRVLLTREGVEIHGLAIDVVQKVVHASKEHLQATREKQESGESSEKEATILGEGGSSGEFPPGTSVVFATLEVCLCGLVRHVPALNPSQSNGFRPPTHMSRMAHTTFDLLARIMRLMVDLLDLCSPTGAATILPTILHLTTSLIKEVCARGATQAPDGFVKACQEVLTYICQYQAVTDGMEEEEAGKVKDDWRKLLQSAMCSILQYAHPDDSSPGMDLGVLVSLLTVFTLTCPKEVSGVSDLLTPTLDIYKEAWDTGDQKNRHACLVAFMSLVRLQDSSVALPYIHCLAPRFVTHLGDPDNLQGSRSSTEYDLLTLELDCLERLVTAAEDERKVTMVGVYVPVLVSFLLDETSNPSASEQRRDLANSCLDRITEAGRLYPTHLRTVMVATPNLKPCLEAAVRLRQSCQAKAKAVEAARLAPTTAKPSITLKMDFGNFKS